MSTAVIHNICLLSADPPLYIVDIWMSCIDIIAQLNSGIMFISFQAGTVPHLSRLYTQKAADTVITFDGFQLLSSLFDNSVLPKQSYPLSSQADALRGIVVFLRFSVFFTSLNKIAQHSMGPR